MRAEALVNIPITYQSETSNHGPITDLPITCAQNIFLVQRFVYVLQRSLRRADALAATAIRLANRGVLAQARGAHDSDVDALTLRLTRLQTRAHPDSTHQARSRPGPRMPRPILIQTL